MNSKNRIKIIRSIFSILSTQRARNNKTFNLKISIVATGSESFGQFVVSSLVGNFIQSFSFLVPAVSEMTLFSDYAYDADNGHTGNNNNPSDLRSR